MSYQAPSEGMPQVVPNSSTAIISLIAGILGLTLLPAIGSVVALITGYMAKKEIAQSGGALGGDGLATAGIVLGWIGVALMAFGLCAFGFALLIPLCLIPIGLSIEGWNLLLPTMLALL